MMIWHQWKKSRSMFVMYWHVLFALMNHVCNIIIIMGLSDVMTHERHQLKLFIRRFVFQKNIILKFLCASYLIKI